MTSLAIASQKGGVGKTTVAVNLAWSLARRGRRTLLVDADPQGAVGASLSRRARQCRGYRDFVEDGTGAAELILRTRLPELSILPAGQPRDGGWLGEKSTQAEAHRIGALMEEAHDYDVVLIDTPPGMPGSAATLLRAVDQVLIPQQAEPLSLRSLPRMLKGVAALRRAGGRLKVAGVLLTMVQAELAECADVERELRALLPGGLVLQTTIPKDPAFVRASAVGVPLGMLFRTPPASALAFDRMAAELEPKLGLDQAAEPRDELSGLLD